MERTLLILRHAKSGWASGHTDHQRPLDERGRRAAPEVGAMLSRMGWLPDLILSSDAERTRETVERMLGENDLVVSTLFLSALYLPRPDDMLRCLAGVPASVRTVMLVSHNPGCEELVWQLTGERVVMKTANVARLEVTPAWSGMLEAKEGSVRLQAVLRPSRSVD